jgi:hypothetical protein
MQEQPKKRQPKKPKSKRINVSDREKWSRILKDVDKEEVPITCLEALNVNLKDGTTVVIDILQLLDEGHEPSEIENRINDKLEKLDYIIKDVDFFVNIDRVAKTIQPLTDKFLASLK